MSLKIEFYENRTVTAHDVSYLLFPGGEAHVRCLVPDGAISAFITCYARTSDDVMAMFMLAGICNDAHLKTALVLPYLPYARQDRVCSPGDAFSLKTFSHMLNSFEFHNVIVHDVHSNEAFGLISGLYSVPQHNLVDPEFDPNSVILVSPDKGAIDKTEQFAGYRGVPSRNIINADKIRNPDTGEITGTVVSSGNLDLKGKHCLIVDDICDGGRTFIEIAKILKQSGAGKITLAVTHGIFSKGKSVFDELIDDVYATHDWTEM